jgi:hypothetical protein
MRVFKNRITISSGGTTLKVEGTEVPRKLLKSSNFFKKSLEFFLFFWIRLSKINFLPLKIFIF